MTYKWRIIKNRSRITKNILPGLLEEIDLFNKNIDENNTSWVESNYWTMVLINELRKNQAENYNINEFTSKLAKLNIEDIFKNNNMYDDVYNKDNGKEIIAYNLNPNELNEAIILYNDGGNRDFYSDIDLLFNEYVLANLESEITTIRDEDIVNMKKINYRFNANIEISEISDTKLNQNLDKVLKISELNKENNLLCTEMLNETILKVFPNMGIFSSISNFNDDNFIRNRRLLTTTNNLVLPTSTEIKFLITSSDVLHCWAVPI